MTLAAEDKVLVLVRHAKAETWRPGGNDHSRRLTDRGHRDAAAAGMWLHAQGIGADLVLLSSSARTRETAQAMASAGLAEADLEHRDEIYDAHPEAILGAIREVGSDVAVLVVIGHAPGIPGLASLLAAGAGSESAHDELGDGMPTSAIAVLSYSGTWSDLHPGDATLEQFHVPRG